MKKIIYRQNNMFIIDREQLKSGARKDDICNALYAALYTEFSGATDNPDYKNKTNLERLQAINKFAFDWLKLRGLI